ncbi:hypothetical protein D3C84_1237150 [compost metagenome]
MEENEENDKLIQQGKDQEAKDKYVPMKVRKETRDYDKKKPAVKTNAAKTDTTKTGKAK